MAHSGSTNPSAHDPLVGYIPAGLTLEQAEALRGSDPDDYLRVTQARTGPIAK